VLKEALPGGALFSLQPLLMKRKSNCMRLLNCILLSIFLFSCRANLLPSSSSGPDSIKSGYTIFIQLIDEGNNYGEIMYVVFKYPGIVEVQDNFQKNLFIGTKVVRIVFKEIEGYKIIDLKKKLQKCSCILEINDAKI
jgi:hypothetical protein